MTRIKFAVLFASLVLVAAACNKQYLVPSASIAGHKINIEIADTDTARVQGLSGRNFLADDAGMAFLFGTPGKYTFWMKDMKFNLDFIWIKNGKIMEITPNVPNTSLQTYQPLELVDSVIEVNAGWVAKNNVKVGDSVGLDR